MLVKCIYTSWIFIGLSLVTLSMGGGWGVDPHNDLHNEPHMIMIGAQARFQLDQPMTVYTFPFPD